MEDRTVPSTVIYDRDFIPSTSATLAPGVTANWSYTNKVQSPSGEWFLGSFGNQTVTLTLNNLPTHDLLNVEFDLYLLRSWDGNDPTWGGPNGDRWGFAIDGQTQVDSTFRNVRPLGPNDVFAGQSQNFGGPAAAGPGPYDSATGSVAINSLGYTFTTPNGTQSMDSTYHFSVPIEHGGSSVTITFTGNGLQGLSDESWGLDNMKISSAPLAGVNIWLGANPPVFNDSSNWSLDRPPIPQDEVVFDGTYSNADAPTFVVYGESYQAVRIVNDYSGTVTSVDPTVGAGVFELRSGTFNQPAISSGGSMANAVFVAGEFLWSGGTLNNTADLATLTVNASALISPYTEDPLLTGSSLVFDTADAEFWAGTVDFINGAGITVRNGGIVTVKPEEIPILAPVPPSPRAEHRFLGVDGKQMPVPEGQITVELGSKFVVSGVNKFANPSEYKSQGPIVLDGGDLVIEKGSFARFSGKNKSESELDGSVAVLNGSSILIENGSALVADGTGVSVDVGGSIYTTWQGTGAQGDLPVASQKATITGDVTHVSGTLKLATGYDEEDAIIGYGSLDINGKLQLESSSTVYMSVDAATGASHQIRATGNIVSLVDDQQTPSVIIEDTGNQGNTTQWTLFISSDGSVSAPPDLVRPPNAPLSTLVPNNLVPPTQWIFKL